MSEHAEIMVLVDQVISDMKHRNEVSINPNVVGDKVAALTDPTRRSPHLAAYGNRMKCHDFARERLRARELAERQEREAAMRDAQGEFVLEPYCPTGTGDEWVQREEMTLDERTAFSESLGKEIETKSAHKEAFDAETRQFILADRFDERGRPRHSRRVFADDPV
jgi:hypothetical protein